MAESVRKTPSEKMDEMLHNISLVISKMDDMNLRLSALENRPPSPRPSPPPFSSPDNHSSHRHFLKLDVPRFDGSDPHGWIFKISQFFDYHSTPEEERITVASFYLDGPALAWFQWMYRNGQIHSWPQLLQALETRFAPTAFDDPREQRENKSGIFGSSSAAVGSTGSGIFGFSSPVTTGNSQSLGSVFGTTTGSIPASGFAPLSERRSVAFGSSASSPLFGLTGNTAFPSGSSLFPSSSSATNIFNVGTTSGQSTPDLEANPVSSSNGTSSSMFGLSSWQPSKSPFGSSFNSSSSPSSGFSFGSSFSSSSSTSSGFSFAASTPSVTSTSSPMMYGSSTVSSTPQFSFSSTAPTTNTQPAFGSSSHVFTFGSASANNNDQMSMQDSMAEDTVQATTPATPVFGQQPAPLQSIFAFGASTPTGASPFQFATQQNIAPQNPSPFQASGSLEFNAGASCRKYVKVKLRSRKK
ncbi:hypothetical protein Fmac_025693 [Flemingia macrophylla]|uniref:Uncharacterized protein n=1 Tax=Flemingia macrophylla TaxID=520843 RepID=A0ABD1LT03_9FABA